MLDTQSQTAGDNSQQIQATTVNQYFGITEERARAIFDERIETALQAYSAEAYESAESRIKQFEDDLIPKLAKSNLLENLKDPSIQLLLYDAQKTAASTEREADYGLLSELLIHRINKGENRKIRTGISEAVKIVDDISDDALLGLTVSHCISKFFPKSGNITEGLSILESLFSKVIYEALPTGYEWLDHLDVLKAMRVSSYGSMKNVKQFYSEELSGYVDVGIKIDSETHNQAKDIIKKNNLPNGVLVEHELRNGYLRIPIRRKDDIDNQPISFQTIEGNTVYISFSEQNKQTIKSIYALYENNKVLRNENIEVLMQKWDNFTNLKMLREWWDAIPLSFSVTSIGRALAQANAQRCYPGLPPIDD
jgi:hypothetical protein